MHGVAVMSEASSECDEIIIIGYEVIHGPTIYSGLHAASP